MNRRHFLTAFMGTAAGLALDPDRLLWIPGAKTVFIPPPSFPFKSYSIPITLEKEIITGLKFMENLDKMIDRRYEQMFKNMQEMFAP